MSLRKPTRLTPQRLQAARRNAQRSTGPRTQAGKERMRMNALKHGCAAAPENEAAVLRALGEDPEQYAALKRDLATTYGPGGALWDQQLEDLARLYWQRNRLERMQTGLMRRALEAVEERQRERRKEIAAATFPPSCSAAMKIDLGQPTDPCVRLRMLLSLLGVLRQQVRQRVFTPRHESEIGTYYRGEIGWRPGRFRHLLWLFDRRAQCERQGDRELHDFVSEYFEGGEAAVESNYQELLGLLEEEIVDVEEEFQHEVEAQEKRDAIERDACLAPEGMTWEALLRQEMALDRSIDRKVKIILTMRKEHARRLREEASRQRMGGTAVGAPLVGARSGRAQGPPLGDEPEEREAQELSKLVGLEGGEVAPKFSSADAPRGRGATQTEGAAEESAAETPKLPEESENDTENKGPAAGASTHEGQRASGKELPSPMYSGQGGLTDPQR